MTNQSEYEEKAFDFLEKVLENISSDTPRDYAFGVVGIGSAIEVFEKTNDYKT
ncbi:hypothetical protein FACS189415_6740 [Bacteroidia bacterium]|nr:hypothetical protein FACS189432_09610 [Bacteroidia bacterium]GHU83757.1 hypothetical protein FACS189415_6740 [Bacteroidia bacterium]GHV70182.1 hypothetical protein FACS189420_0220 [Bacteroidia bacterium]